MINDVNKVEIKDNDHLSSEKLNSIGDLHLKKGDRNTAITYFYKAASKLPFAHKEKALAIYKKIINISPSESGAYEEIINIFARTGLAGEETRYLLILAHLYHEQKEYNKVNSIYRRVSEIDPQNVIAERYFQKGKQFAEDIDLSKPVIAKEQEMVESEKVDHLTVTEEIKEEGTETIPDKGEGLGGDKEAVLRIRDRADQGLFTVTLEESAHEKKPFYMPEQQIYMPGKQESHKKVFIYTGISVLLVIALVAIFVLKGRFKDNILKDKSEKVWVDNKVEVKTGNYEISVVRISKEMMDESGIPGVINQNDIQKNQFYYTSIKAINGCLPGDFAMSPNKMIYLMKGDGLLDDMKEIKGLSDLNKTIYRSNIAGCGNFSPVFTKIIIAHDRDLRYSGISVKGLERDHPVTVRWN